MRLVLKLESLKSVRQNKENNSKFFTGMHGFIYKLLKQGEFAKIYSNVNFKPFCFSNLYPIQKETIKEGEIYNVVISSPNEFLIIHLISTFQKRIIENGNKTFNGTIINLGEYSFELIDFKPLPPISIKEGAILESENLINISIKKNEKIYSLNLNEDREIFIKQLSRNLIKKYNYFTKEDVNLSFPLFDNINIEQISEKKAIKLNFVKKSDNWFNVIGARYKFKINKLNETQKKILQLCYDLGFGERNTFGFGFINLKKKNL